MPAKRFRLTCRHVFTLVALLCVSVAGVKAQTGGVTLQGSVSKTIALSVLPNSTNGNVETDVTSSGNTVRIMLSGDTTEAPVIRLPLLVRSNSNFKITAVVESKAAAVAQLSVTDVRATGTWVSPQAIAGVTVPRQLDLRGLNESASSAPNLLDTGLPLLVLSGPRVSAGGTLVSPNNALQITLVIGLKPQPAHVWPIHLTLVGSPE
jgi:hypothetical protein